MVKFKNSNKLKKSDELIKTYKQEVFSGLKYGKISRASVIQTTK